MFDILGGKALFFNNLVDIDVVVGLMCEFQDVDFIFVIFKYINLCGVVIWLMFFQAWMDVFVVDNVFVFGGILIVNMMVDLVIVQEIDKIFYEVFIVLDFVLEVQEFFLKKKKCILFCIKVFYVYECSFKSLFNGVIEQDINLKMEIVEELEMVI